MRENSGKFPIPDPVLHPPNAVKISDIGVVGFHLDSSTLFTKNLSVYSE